MASMFPKRKWLVWEGSNRDSDTLDKRDAIQGYISWAIDYPGFKSEVEKLVLDYIDYGNCFATCDWIDRTVEESFPSHPKFQAGYVGPSLRRISPLDIVFNPTAESFEETPKIVRSIVSIGEVAEILQRATKPDNTDDIEELISYLKGIRRQAYTSAETGVLDAYLSMDGFTSFSNYLQSNYCELLTFYGDIYDIEHDTLLKNYVVIIADRHKVILKKANPSFFGTAPIFHCGWRRRQDNLWAMGPLDNLIGMQYRIDHIENLKADVFDLVTFPLLKIKGMVEDFEWGPFERIYVGDEGDVEMVAPPFQAMASNQEIQYLMNLMEEMAGSPKEAMGFRTPGEKTAYEVQRLENAASRIFQAKISQFEEQMLERCLNAMLEIGRRRMTTSTIKILDDELQATTFMSLTPEDITGVGRIRPIAARHFAERAELVQNINNFFGSAVGQDPEIRAHWSAIGLSKLMENALDIAEYKIVKPYIRIAEQADMKRAMQSGQEQTNMEALTPSGLAQDDTSAPLEMPGMPSELA